MKQLMRLSCLGLAMLMLSTAPAAAQHRDSLLNGAVVGAAVGAAIGVAMNYALRDSDLTVGQYAYGAVVYGALGAGIGLGVDALFSRSSPRPYASPRLLFAPAVGRVSGVKVTWRW